MVRLNNLEKASWLISPTKFQYDQLPTKYKDKAIYLYDGIDTDKIKPSRKAS